MRKSLCVILLATAALLAKADKWAIPDTTLRFDYTVESSPSVPTAGILVFIPDGGLLPTPEPRPVVLDGAGKPVDFDTLWLNPQEGMALVIAKPATPTFSVYIGRQNRLMRNERVSFTPGPLFYVKYGNPGLETAAKLPNGYPPGRDCSMGPVAMIGQQENPLGPDQDFSAWFSAWIKVDKPGKYYFATISDEGSQVKIDGKNVAEWPGLHTRQAGAKGQFGSQVELTAGVHQVDYFYFNQGGLSEAQLAWRPPATSADLPILVPASAYVTSGRSKLTGVAEREGGPVALPLAPVENYLWYGDKAEFLHRLSCQFADQQPAGTTYEWKLENGLVVKEAAFPWLFEGEGPHTATLTVKSGAKSSTASRLIRIVTTPPQANVNLVTHRQNYRTALLTRCRAVQPPAKPAEDWRPDLWQILLNVVEPFKGQGLLTELFERSREDVVKQLEGNDRALVEETYIENLRYSQPDQAATWLERLEREEKNIDRRRNWTLTRVELALYQQSNTNLARQIAATLAGQASGTEAGVLALVRLGDIEALGGRFDAARAQYALAQSQSPRKTFSTPMSGGGAPALAKNKTELEEQKKNTAPKTAPPASLRKVDQWKAEAVRGGAYYETIRDLLRTGFLREARLELRNWELELPTEKLGGEYPVAEAEYYMAIRDYPRVRIILSTYRQAVDVSPFMPRAMGMELDCLQKLGRQDEAAALAAIVIKRFPGLPVAEQARQVVAMGSRSSAPPQTTAVEVK